MGLLVYHHRHPDAAVRMAAARELSPAGVRPMNQVGPICESRQEGNWEPVPRRLAQSCLALHVARQMGKGVALRPAALVRDRLVAARERDRLKSEEGDLLRVVERE